MYCFVCNADVENPFDMRDIVLETSKTPVLEKLGQLFPERFYLVCENDVICEACVASLNELDLLDVERNRLRKNVLGLIEKKYKLNDGELSNQIEEPKHEPGSFRARKRQSEEELEKIMSLSSEDPRSRIWMQCKTCKYTTNYTQFVKRHVKKSACEICGGRVDKHSNCVQRCVEPEQGSPLLKNMSSFESMLIQDMLSGEDKSGSALLKEDDAFDEGISVTEENAEGEPKELYYNVLDGDESINEREGLVSGSSG